MVHKFHVELRVAAAVSLDVRQDEAGDLEEEIDEAEEEEELRRHPREIDLSGPAWT